MEDTSPDVSPAALSWRPLIQEEGRFQKTGAALVEADEIPTASEQLQQAGIIIQAAPIEKWTQQKAHFKRKIIFWGAAYRCRSAAFRRSQTMKSSGWLLNRKLVCWNALE